MLDVPNIVLTVSSAISQGVADKGPSYGPGPASWEKPRMGRR